jgi:hypothetical protein
MKKLLLLLLLVSSVSLSLSAQDGGVKASLRGGASFDDTLDGSYFNFDVILGYQFKDFIYVGVGTGVNNSFNEMRWEADPVGPPYTGSSSGRETDRLIPLFGRAKYNITRSRISPFVAVDAGYLFAKTGKVSKNDEGFFGIPAIGVDFFVGKGLKHYISVQIGLLIQENDYRKTAEAPVELTRSVVYYGEDSAEWVLRPDIKVALTF